MRLQKGRHMQFILMISIPLARGHNDRAPQLLPFICSQVAPHRGHSTSFLQDFRVNITRAYLISQRLARPLSSAGRPARD